MIVSKVIEKFPADILSYLTDFSAEEFRRAGGRHNEAVRNSTIAWEIGDEEPIFFAGLIEGKSLIGPSPLIWFLFCKAFRPIHARHFTTLLEELLGIYGRVETIVQTGFEEGERLVEFAGFAPVRNLVIMDIPHTVYEAK